MRALENIGLGQVKVDIPQSLLNQLVHRMITEAEPKVRDLLAAERERIADAIIKTLPMAGGSLVAFLTTLFFIPSEFKTVKFLGYLVAGGLFLGGTYVFFHEMQTTAGPALPVVPEEARPEQKHAVEISI